MVNFHSTQNLEKVKYVFNTYKKNNYLVQNNECNAPEFLFCEIRFLKYINKVINIKSKIYNFYAKINALKILHALDKSPETFYCNDYHLQIFP